jgi:sterol desaturase/sphingolipid hydroxylase (fatty acid hydroxylase superfamily)
VVDVCVRSAIVRLPILYFLYDVYKACGMPALRSPLPSLATVAAEWLIALVVNDTAFYWTHRVMHHRLLYRRFHKKHHEFKVRSPVHIFLVGCLVLLHAAHATRIHTQS